VAHPFSQEILEEPKASNQNVIAAFLYFSTEVVPVTDSLVLSLRADRGLTLAADGTVSQWANGVSNQAATVVETGLAPVFLASDSSMNGRPSVVFSAGGMEYLNLTLGDQVTYFVALRHSLSGVHVITEHGEDTNSTNAGGMYLASGNTNTSAFRRGPGTFGTTMSTRDADANWATTNEALYVTVQYGGADASHIVRINGVQPSLLAVFTNNPTGSVTASFYFGGRPRPIVPGEFLYMEGAIAEILVYDRALTLDEIQNVENYLSKRYRP
tara:strand:+ start:28710 stop:29519 length:810 start_codon:yes stop_codon:yes gene_type:complete